MPVRKGVMVMGAIFGIDFGTSNSALSVNIDGQTEAIELDEHNTNTKLLPSIIFYDYFEKEFLFGQQAIERYIETDAEGRYIQSVKTYLPDLNFKSTDIAGTTHSLEQLVSLVLKHIKSKGENHLKSEITDAVIGRPVVFSEDKEKEELAEKRLLDAARLAGFKNIYLEYEPVAAASFYEQTLDAHQEQLVLICDFGGGTSDFSVLKACGRNKKSYLERRKDILSLGGCTVGGNTLDSSLMWSEVAKTFGKNVKLSYPMTKNVVSMPGSIMNRLRKWHLIPQLNTPKTMRYLHEIERFADEPQCIRNLISLIEHNHGYSLFKAIEKAKIELSGREQTVIEYKDYNISVHQPVAIARFNETIANDIERIIHSIKTTVSSAGLGNNQIDKVMLTGGTSNVPLINSYLTATFGREKIINTDAFTSVGQGLGFCGNQYM